VDEVENYVLQKKEGVTCWPKLTFRRHTGLSQFTHRADCSWAWCGMTKYLWT